MIRNWDEKDEAEATQSVWSELSLGGGPARHLTRDGPRQLCPGLGTHLGAERWGRGEQALRCPCCRGYGAQGDAADTSLDCFRFLQLAGRRLYCLSSLKRDLGSERLSHFFSITQSLFAGLRFKGFSDSQFQTLRVFRHMALLFVLDEYYGHRCREWWEQD